MSRSSKIAIAAVMFGACAMPARAQDAPVGTPDRRSFGAERLKPGPRQSLTLSTQSFESYDTDLFAEQGTPLLSSGARGLSSGFSLGISYRQLHGSESFRLNAETAVRYYPQVGGLSTMNDSVDASFSTGLGRHTRLQMQESTATSPFYVVAFFIDPLAAGSLAAPATDSNYSTFRWKNTSLSHSVDLTREIGRRSTLTIQYGLRNVKLDAATSRTQSAGVTFLYRISRNATARAGYSQRLANYRGLLGTQQQRGRSHDLDLGIDYNRPLSFSRRMTLAFRSGSSIVPGKNGAQYDVLAAAALTRQIGRTWSTSLEYGRNLQFVDTFTQPLLADTVSIRAAGTLNRRLDLSVSSGMSKGAVGFGIGDHAYASYNAAVRTRWTLNRFIAAYVEYTDYRQLVGPDVQMTAGFGRSVNRREARVGLTTWASLLH